MKKKISLIIITIIILLGTIMGINIAKQVTIGGKEKNLNDGGKYSSAFLGKGRGLYNKTWDNVKDKYYTITGNDYNNNVNNSKDCLCLNHKAMDSDEYKVGMRLRVAGIIDIYGGYVEVQGNLKSKDGRYYAGEYAARMAYMAYDKYKTKTWEAEAFAYWNGWHNLCNAAELNINKEPSLKASATSTYENLYKVDKDKYLNIDMTDNTSSGNLKIEYPGSGDYKTIISGYNISGIKEKATKTVKIKAGGKEYSAIYKDGQVKSKNKITDKISEITLKQSYKSYRARLIVLATNYSQSRLVTYGEDNEEVSKTINLKIPPQKVNVSLQKYIIKVQHANGEITFNDANSRKNKGGTSSHTNSGKISKNNNDTGYNYKNDSPVMIEAGDIVTYRIKVYNNGSTDADNIKIKDFTPSNTTIIGGMQSSGIIDVGGLGAGEGKNCDVTLRFDKYETIQKWNDAEIYQTTPENETTYRTKDGDSIKMKEYAVSLEKYISKVNGTELSKGIIYPNILEYLRIKYTGNYSEGLRHLIEKGDINKDSRVNSEDLELLKKYIDTGIATKINRNGEINNTAVNINDWKKADINEDGSIDAKDVEIYKTLTGRSQTIEKIQQYLRLDINGDGKFDREDCKQYQLMIADINEDGVVSAIQSTKECDRSIFGVYSKKIDKEKLANIKVGILKEINKFYKPRNDYTNKKKLYINALLVRDSNKKIYKEFFNNEYWKNEKTYIHKYCDAQTQLDSDYLKENIQNKNNMTIGAIKDIIQKYDLNQDGLIDSKDIDYAKADATYKKESDYYERTIKEAIEKYDIDKNEAIEEEILHVTYDLKNKNGGTISYSAEEFASLTPDDLKEKELIGVRQTISGDILTLQKENVFVDYIAVLKEEGNKEYGTYRISYQNINSIIYNTSDIIYNSSENQYKLYDINTDGKIDENDIQSYETHKGEYIEALDSRCDDYEGDIRRISDYIEEYGDINFGRLNNLQSKDSFYGKSYDAICESNIDFNNIDKKTNIPKGDTDNYLAEQDINEDGIINYEDYERLCELDLNGDKKVDENDKIIYKHFKNSNYLIRAVRQHYYEFEEKYIDSKHGGEIKLEDYSKIKEKLIKNDENILMGKEYFIFTNEELNVNGDENIGQEDIDILNQYSPYSENCSKIDNVQYIENIINCDINGDGIFNKNDYDIIQSYLKNTDIDMNEDGEVDGNDLKLLSEVIVVSGKKTEEQRQIIGYMQNTNMSLRWKSAEHKYDNKPTTNNSWKRNNVITVEPNNSVTYTIVLRNDSSDTSVYITEILDTLSTNLEFESGINEEIINGIQAKITRTAGILLAPGATTTCDITVKVTKSKMFIDVITNKAEIKSLENINRVSVTDSTQNNNQDRDYFQLPDITISGNVWNDKTIDKKQENYNGIYDKETESALSGIKVQLYRDGKGIVATKFTDSEGKYSFGSVDSGNVLTNFIKGPKASLNSDGGWNGSSYNGNLNGTVKGGYYSYYVVFTYDGITYTSTPDGNTYRKISDDYQGVGKGNYRINSNACEDKVPARESRTNFNNRFLKINNASNIKYTTKNEDGYIPQSNHIYNEETMSIQSSTELITFKNDEKLEEQLKYVNLGLRGKDVFDLELTSNVSKVQVTVNNKVGVYNYTNKINIRNTDVGQSEDMANVESETASQYLYDSNKNEVKQEQALRDTDLNTSSAYTGTNEISYSKEQGIQDIQVTYKVTVTNASQTDGIATSIINYYDKAYVVEKDNLNAYIEMNGKKISNLTYTNYENIRILKFDMENAVGNSNLKQSESYDLYYTLTMTSNTITKLKDYMQANESNEKVGKLIYPTYNMSEIFEYKTKAGTGQTEYTRGLLDKDSAPGSIAKEQVRLTTTINQTTPTENGTPSTLTYYTNGKELEKLKYEDDTCTTPTLYFVSQNTTDSGKGRKISGTVFEDYTAIIDNNDGSEIRTKTGDGIQTGDEPGIEGVTVDLLEKVDNTYKIRYSTKTDKDGHFEFNNFLPGDYKIRYIFGKIDETFLYSNGLNINTKSYNGEDFQSTNNTGKIGNDASKTEYETATGGTIILNKIDDTPKFWYAINENEGISTAVEDSNMRMDISNKVSAFSDDEMSVLNNARDGKSESECTEPKGYVEGKTQIKAESIAEKTYIISDTKDMELTTEETVDTSKIENAEQLIQDGKIVQKENGVGEWAIFPNSNETYKEYHVNNMNFGIAEVPVTTLDLQKHIKKFKITDSAGNNTIAEVEAKNESQVTVNPSKVAANKIDIVINVLSKDLGMEKDIIKNLIGYSNKSDKQEDSNKIITASATATQVKNLQYDMTMYSLAREITITRTWDIKAGNVLAAPGIDVLDVSIEDEKLQGAKLEVTYDITSSIYAEKNFNNGSVTVPSIVGIADYIDNNLSYNGELENNKEKWTVSTYEDIIDAYDKQAEYESKLSNSVKDTRKGTLDTTAKGTKYTTIVEAIDNNVLLETCGTGSTEITLEKILSSTDSSISDIITSSIDTYEYGNSLEITRIDYKNATGETTGDFIFRDRVRTADRYIVLAGRQHDAATAETIAIHPPTGKNNNINYYIVALVSSTVLTGGIIAIKKKVLKNNRK